MGPLVRKETRPTASKCTHTHLRLTHCKQFSCGFAKIALDLYINIRVVISVITVCSDSRAWEMASFDNCDLLPVFTISSCLDLSMKYSAADKSKRHNLNGNLWAWRVIWGISPDDSEKGKREKSDRGLRIWKIWKLHCSYSKRCRRTVWKGWTGNPICYCYYYFTLFLFS